MHHAILVIGHGSRSFDAVRIFGQVIDYIRSKSSSPHVYGAHMELSSPSIEEGVKEIYQKGIRTIIVVPYFLYPGIHIQEDIPQILNRLKTEQFEDVEFQLADPLGFEPAIADILIQRSKDVLKGV